MDVDAALALTMRRNDAAGAFAEEARGKASAMGWEAPPSPLALRELAVLVRATHSTFVLELGTGTGLGTIAMASAFGLTGRLDTIEPDAARAAFAEAALRRFGLEERARLHQTGYADAFRGMSGPYDLVVVSRLGPGQGGDVYEPIMRLVRIGGSIVVAAEAGAGLWERLADDVRVLPAFGRDGGATLAVRLR